MIVRLTRISAVLAVLTSLPAIALADTPPATPPMAAPAAALPMASEPDPDRLALGREILTIVLPADRGQDIIAKATNSIIGPMTEQLKSKLPHDHGLDVMMNDFIKACLNESNATIGQMLPDMREAMARAYARTFTRDELTQILAFGHTPAGNRYLTRSSDLLQDRDVQAFNARLYPAIQAHLQPLQADFIAKMVAYLKAHPELTKQAAPAK